MLRHISRQYFTNTIRKDNYILPISVDTVCPHCNKKANFRLNWSDRLSQIVDYSQTHCPACQQTVLFIYLTQTNEKVNIKTGELFINPSGNERSPLQEIDQIDTISEPLKKAYYSTINVYNANEWTATSVLCRRVLEGIIKSIITDEKKYVPLASQLKELPNYINLSKPILTLADAIRKGGNLGAHFDDEKEPNKEICKSMMDFIDYLIEYLFILPAKIKLLHDNIEQ